jgi:hypothetical protein
MRRNRKRNNRTGIAEIAAGIGIGIVAGFVGTVVMTAAQMVEMKITGRKASDTPYKAVKKIFGIEAKTEDDKELLSNFTHFAYGTIWGVPRGVLTVFGVNGIAGTTAHFAGIWGTEITALPSMDVIEPVTTWTPKAITSDALFHGVYAVATGLTADYLNKRLRRSGNS